MVSAEEFVQKFARPILNLLFDVTPVIIGIARSVYKVYKRLPLNYVHLLIGTVMCFFGGFYPTVFAALQVSSLQRYEKDM